MVDEVFTLRVLSNPYRFDDSSISDAYSLLHDYEVIEGDAREISFLRLGRPIRVYPGTVQIVAGMQIEVYQVSPESNSFRLLDQ